MLPQPLWDGFAIAFGLCCGLVVFFLYPVIEEWKVRRHRRRHGWFADEERWGGSDDHNR
jgi:hypothetical protein